MSHNNIDTNGFWTLKCPKLNYDLFSKFSISASLADLSSRRDFSCLKQFVSKMFKQTAGEDWNDNLSHRSVARMATLRNYALIFILLGFINGIVMVPVDREERLFVSNFS